MVAGLFVYTSRSRKEIKMLQMLLDWPAAEAMAMAQVESAGTNEGEVFIKSDKVQCYCSSLLPEQTSDGVAPTLTSMNNGKNSFKSSLLRPSPRVKAQRDSKAALSLISSPVCLHLDCQ